MAVVGIPTMMFVAAPGHFGRPDRGRSIVGANLAAISAHQAGH
jgi:hypothetical protein